VSILYTTGNNFIGVVKIDQLTQNYYENQRQKCTDVNYKAKKVPYDYWISGISERSWDFRRGNKFSNVYAL